MSDGESGGPVQAVNVAGPVYEMLWDCSFCGTCKLLGLTHRHCPVCGAPQAAEARYFPPDDEKVPARNHVYYGVDRKCGSCGEANSRASKHCRGCGAPLDGAQEVARRDEQGPPASKLRAARAAVAPKRKRRGRAVAAGVVLTWAGLGASLLWSKPTQLEVTGHEWRREIAVERFGPSEQSGWCDGLPSGARVIKQSREVREHRQIEDGEECSTRKVDLGNGGFTEEQDCHPRYRDEPVYDDRCTYLIDRWERIRTETLQGASLSDAPRWPAVHLARRGQCVGCEREGARQESFSVVLRDPGGSLHRCDFEQTRWASLSVGTWLNGEVGVVAGDVRCGSLKAR
jgi:hypothetical protein